MNAIQHKSIKLLLAVIILGSCIGCDQVTKSMAIHSLRDQPSRSFLADTIRLDFAENPGGFLSLGANLPDGFRTNFFIVTNCLMMLGVVAFLFVKRKIPLLLFVSIVYVVAGGASNLIDRVTNNGLVIDFINMGIGPLRTGVFNVADMAITFGAIAAAFLSVGRETEEAKEVCGPVR